jgi:hypothetical protein
MIRCIKVSLLLFCIPPFAYIGPVSCQKGLSNLLTMAIGNIVTDIALILLPIPVLWTMRLSTAKSVTNDPSAVVLANGSQSEKYN